MKITKISEIKNFFIKNVIILKGMNSKLVLHEYYLFIEGKLAYDRVKVKYYILFVRIE
jgi:hypothetical protein